MASPDNQRFGSFLRSKLGGSASSPSGRQDAAGGGSASPSGETMESLWAKVANLQTENRKLTDDLQKATVERSLLKDLVDQAYGGDEGDASTGVESRKEMLQWQTDKAELTIKLQDAEAATVAATKASEGLTKRAAVFEAEVNRLQAELKESDVSATNMQKAVAERDAAQASLTATKAQLDDTQGTVSVLMDRIAAAEKQHKQTEKELTAVIDKTARAASDAQEELSHTTDALTAAQQEVAQLRVALHHLETTGAAVAAATPSAEDVAAAKATENALLEAQQELQRFATEAEELKQSLSDQQEETVEHNAMISRLTEDLLTKEADLRELQANYDTVCGECTSLHTALDDEEGNGAALRQSLEETVAARQAAESQIADANAKHAQSELVNRDLKQGIDTVRAENTELCATVKGLREDLQRRSEQLEAAEDHHRELHDARAAAEEEAASRLAAVESERDQLADRLADADSALNLKLRLAQSRAKELQNQLAKMESEREAKGNSSSESNLPAGSGPSTAAGRVDDTVHQENVQLLNRLATAQEQVWSLQTTKSNYEDEIVRLNKALKEKSRIVRMYFEEAARNLPTEKRPKSGFSKLFSSDNVKEADVAVAMQEHLEDAMNDRLALHDEVVDLRKEIASLHEALDRAVLMGFDPDGDAALDGTTSVSPAAGVSPARATTTSATVSGRTTTPPPFVPRQSSVDGAFGEDDGDSRQEESQPTTTANGRADPPEAAVAAPPRPAAPAVVALPKIPNVRGRRGSIGSGAPRSATPRGGGYNTPRRAVHADPTLPSHLHEGGDAFE